MKKATLFTMMAILFSFIGHSQGIKLGIKSGVNFATLKPDLNDPATRTSFHFGGMAEIAMTDQLAIQPELLYSAQGVKDKSDDDEIIKFDYLIIPVLAKYSVTEALSIEAGPQIGILLSAEGEDDGETFDLKDSTKSTDIGVALGLGYKLENGINFNARYFFGGNVLDDGSDSGKLKNNVIQFSIGYWFN